jgi:hypothetical protein
MRASTRSVGGQRDRRLSSMPPQGALERPVLVRGSRLADAASVRQVSERAPYSRVYWEIADDPKFATVFDSDPNLAAWLRLLLIADQAYPSSGHVPANCRKASLLALEDAGLITRSGSRFRLKGLEAERERRKAAATTRGPSGPRTVPGRSPDGELDKPRQDETSQGLAEARDPADIYWQLTGRFPTEKALAWVDSLAEQYGAEAFITALVGAHVEDRSQQTLLGRAKDKLAADARKLDLKERREEKARLAEKRAQPRAEKQWLQEYRALVEQQYREAS